MNSSPETTDAVVEQGFAAAVEHLGLDPTTLPMRLAQTMATGGTFGQALKVSAAYIEAFYELGRVKLQANALDEAVAMFRMACMLDHWNKKHWLGLGRALRKLGQTNAAGQCFCFAFAVARDDFAPLLQAIGCFTLAGEDAAARELVGVVDTLRRAGNLPEALRASWQDGDAVTLEALRSKLSKRSARP